MATAKKSSKAKGTKKAAKKGAFGLTKKQRSSLKKAGDRAGRGAFGMSKSQESMAKRLAAGVKPRKGSRAGGKKAAGDG
jgi:hypothetical protein